mgnify:CR=1 FL=1
MYYRKLIEKAAEALEKRGWNVHTAETGDDARRIALSLIQEGVSVGIPGSVTVREIGLIEPLAKKCRVVQHWIKAPRDVKDQLRRREVECDVFIHSPNAVSLDGYIVICDMYGNRIAGSVLGPKTLILIAGINKLTPNLWEALERARIIAAGINAARLDKQPEDIRYITLILEKAPLAIPNKHIILVNQHLGF